MNVEEGPHVGVDGSQRGHLKPSGSSTAAVNSGAVPSVVATGSQRGSVVEPGPATGARRLE
jgi:hypothetical protein